ncbi:MAG: hypothetical protein AAB597_01485 [Patescibacteria group bacterium]
MIYSRPILPVSISILVVALLVYTVLLQMFISTMAEVNSVSVELSSVSKNADDSMDLRKALLQSESERDKLSSYILSEDTVASFVDSLETLSKSTGTSMEVSSIGVESSKDLLYHENLSLRLSVLGSLDGVYRFLSLLETVPGGKLTEVYLGASEDITGKGRLFRTSVTISMLKSKNKLP